VRPAVEGFAERLGRARLLVLPEQLFGQIATTESPQGVMALVRPPAWTLEQIFAGRALAVILDGLQDPGNAGAIVRSAEAFGSTGVVYLKGAVSPWNPKAVRASAGSLFRVPVATGAERSRTVAACRQSGVALFAASVQARLAGHAAGLAGPCAIIIGNEGQGLSPEWAEAAAGIRIPTRGVESLNAALAAGILLYEASRQRGHPD
jgi:RNA methyltransferase, TrmH family